MVTCQSDDSLGGNELFTANGTVFRHLETECSHEDRLCAGNLLLDIATVLGPLSGGDLSVLDYDRLHVFILTNSIKINLDVALSFHIVSRLSYVFRFGFNFKITKSVVLNHVGFEFKRHNSSTVLAIVFVLHLCLSRGLRLHEFIIAGTTTANRVLKQNEA